MEKCTKGIAAAAAAIILIEKVSAMKEPHTQEAARVDDSHKKDHQVGETGQRQSEPFSEVENTQHVNEDGCR